MAKTQRLDAALLARTLAESPRQATGEIMAGTVYVNGQRADKPGMPVSDGDHIEIHAKNLRYVSRGGLKLEKALAVFPLDLQGKICADIGASTGGFTDCMLQNGAAKVYAVDVGYGQLAWKLRGDPRVVNLERTNFRYVTAQQIPEPLDFASVDVSFISLSKILPPLRALLKPAGEVVVLIKPQFEAHRDEVGEKGVVRAPEIHVRVLERTLASIGEAGFRALRLSFSPIRGPEGNIEYLAQLCLGEAATHPVQPLVEEAFAAFETPQETK